MTEPIVKRLERTGRAEFLPAPGNEVLGSWWLIPASMVAQILATARFERRSLSQDTYRRWSLTGGDDASDTFVEQAFSTSVFGRS